MIFLVLLISVDVWKALLRINEEELKRKDVFESKPIIAQLFNETEKKPLVKDNEDASSILEDSYSQSYQHGSTKNPFLSPQSDHSYRQVPSTNPFSAESPKVVFSPFSSFSSRKSDKLTYPIPFIRYDASLSPHSQRRINQYPSPAYPTEEEFDYFFSRDGHRKTNPFEDVEDSTHLAVDIPPSPLESVNTPPSQKDEKEMKYREDFPPTKYTEDNQPVDYTDNFPPTEYTEDNQPVDYTDNFPPIQTTSSSPLYEDRVEQRSLIHQDKDRCRFNSVSKSISILYSNYDVDAKNAKRLEMLLNDWLDANPQQDYIQGILAVAGILVLTVKDRLLCEEILNILFISLFSILFSPSFFTYNNKEVLCMFFREAGNLRFVSYFLP